MGPFWRAAMHLHHLDQNDNVLGISTIDLGNLIMILLGLMLSLLFYPWRVT
jgi:hypothetical protein